MSKKTKQVQTDEATKFAVAALLLVLAPSLSAAGERLRDYLLDR